MSDTIRESIIASIVSKLADVRTANSYNTDAGRLVKRGVRIVDQDTLPALSILPETEENEGIAGRHVLTMRLRVEGLIKYTSKNPSVVAEALLGDIIYRMTYPTLTAVDGGYAVVDLHYQKLPVAEHQRCAKVGETPQEDDHCSRQKPGHHQRKRYVPEHL